MKKKEIKEEIKIIEESLIFTENEVFNIYEKELNDIAIDFFEWNLKKDRYNNLIYHNEWFPVICNKRFLIEYNENAIKNRLHHNYITFRPLRNVKHCLLILDTLETASYNGIDLNDLYINKNEDGIYEFKSNGEVIFETKNDSEVEARLIFSYIKIIGEDPLKLIKKIKKFDKANNIIKIEIDPEAINNKKIKRN